MHRYSFLQSIAWLAYKIQSYILRIIARKTPFYHAKSRSKIAGLSCFFWTFCNSFLNCHPDISPYAVIRRFYAFSG